MSAPSTSGLSVGLLLRVIVVKYGCLLYFTYNQKCNFLVLHGLRIFLNYLWPLSFSKRVLVLIHSQEGKFSFASEFKLIFI